MPSRAGQAGGRKNLHSSGEMTRSQRGLRPEPRATNPQIPPIYADWVLLNLWNLGNLWMISWSFAWFVVKNLDSRLRGNDMNENPCLRRVYQRPIEISVLSGFHLTANSRACIIFTQLNRES
jgi:hypothetical protein